MANPPPADLPRLKRFANLDIDIDGVSVSRPPKAPKAAPLAARAPSNAHVTLPPEDADERAARNLAAELSDNARTTLGNTRAEAMRQARAADLSRMRPRDPVPTPAALRPPIPRPRLPESPPRPTTVALRSRPMPEPRFARASDDDDERFPPDASPGVITIAIAARGDFAREERTASVRGASMSPIAPRARPAAPIEVTPLAARQILLMAWQSGMQGSGLRIFMTRVPGLGGPELDFAFDDHAAPDDVVFESNGVRVLCDAATLAFARGRRITFHDVPTEFGIGAFRLA